MSEQQTKGSNFEERLLVRLKAAVAERGAAEAGSEAAAPVAARHRWRRPARLALAGAAALAVAAAVLVFSSGGDNPAKAFAVEPQKGGGVTIKVYSLEDASGLEKALRDAGIKSQVTWLPAGMTCREPHFTPSTAKTTLGGTMAGPAPAISIGVMSPGQDRKRWREYRRGEISAEEYRESSPNISLDPAEFRPDQTVILFGSPIPHGGDPEGGFQARFAVAEGPVEPCRPVTAPASSIGAIGLPRTAREGADSAPGGGQAPLAGVVAEASDAPAEPLPAPGQFLYAKTKVVELQVWEPDGPGTGSRKKPRYFTAHPPDPKPTRSPPWCRRKKRPGRPPTGRCAFANRWAGSNSSPAPTRRAGKRRARRPPSPTTPANTTCAATAPAPW